MHILEDRLQRTVIPAANDQFADLALRPENRGKLRRLALSEAPAGGDYRSVRMTLFQATITWKVFDRRERLAPTRRVETLKGEQQIRFATFISPHQGGHFSDADSAAIWHRTKVQNAKRNHFHGASPTWHPGLLASSPDSDARHIPECRIVPNLFPTSSRGWEQVFAFICSSLSRLFPTSSCSQPLQDLCVG